MLGHVVAQKRGRRRQPAPLPLGKMASPASEMMRNCVSYNNFVLSPTTHLQQRRTRKAVQDVSNQKITEFFQVRRSNRKTGKQIEEEETDALRYALHHCTNENLLVVYQDSNKGRGIKAARDFMKNEFVIEYKGTMMTYAEAKGLEEKYSMDHSIGSYMYFFMWKNKRWCIDATPESPYKGRLINHSMLRPNLRTKVVEFDGKMHLILVAKRNIMKNEELLYDYGDRTPETIAKNPWLINT